MTISTQYGMAQLLNTSFRTFSKREGSITSNLVRIKKINKGSEQTKIYIEPLGLTDINVLKEATSILKQQELAILYDLPLNGSRTVVFRTWESNAESIESDYDRDVRFGHKPQDISLIYKQSDTEHQISQVSATNYFEGDDSQKTVTFFKKWYATSLNTLKAIKASKN